MEIAGAVIAGLSALIAFFSNAFFSSTLADGLFKRIHRDDRELIVTAPTGETIIVRASELTRDRVREIISSSGLPTMSRPSGSLGS